MDSPFIYDRYVTDKNFIGRRMERQILANLIRAGEHISIYEPPKTGKMSLVNQVFRDLRDGGTQFLVAFVDMLNVRTLEDFLVKFGSAVMKSMASTQDQFATIVSTYLADTHFVFDRMMYMTKEEVVSLNWTPDRNDIEQMLSLPQKLASANGIRYIVVLKEFQNLMNADEYDDVFKMMETQMKERDRQIPYPAVFIMTGSMVNAMKYIFEEKRYFWRQVNHVALSQVEQREIIEHLVKGFLSGMGKSFDRNLAMGACELFKSNLWYMNHLASICDALSKGFVTEAMMAGALESMISVHEPRFVNIVNDLTDHQLSLVRAVLDGVMKFSASEVIEKYHLNSSANVRRVKDALKKKEVLTFNEKDEPVIMDPLFEYWLRKFYFEIPE
ncbi:MAG: ATP-binding protein [Bacteroidales bacterium]|nr:ATP-binding protein [Bacteroidales bacterium]